MKLFVVSSLIAVALAASPAPDNEPSEISTPIDLGWGFDENTVTVPGWSPFKFTKKHAGPSPVGVWFSLNDYAAAEHCGTHLDSPSHFNERGRPVGDIPLDRLITQAVLINATKETNNNPNYTLPASKLQQWVDTHGPLPDNAVILVTFGWAQKYGTDEYTGKSNRAFPGLSEEAAQWIIRSKKVVGLGVDTPSVDNPINAKRPVHVQLAAQDLYNLENVALNQPLPYKFKIIVMPMKIVKGTGAPVRIIAVP